ncbi:response regulator transcription factor [Bradyrhizobium liaoningense]|uniref:response regulator transcription factor n=1 Tax=Bradyrhizobium liaoningense TaxID=43992 RepID=UPI001FEBF2AB|nr:response regulator transcription factor [Bradyrhizobium liaoningense]
MAKDIDDRDEAKSMLDVSAKQEIFRRIRLVIVDSQPIVLHGLKSVLGTQPDLDVVASSSDGRSCLDAIRKLSPDLALVADTLPDLTASEILAIAKAEKLSTSLVFFTESDVDGDLAAAIAAGACSAISKYAAPATMLQSLRLTTTSGVSLEPCDLSPNGNEAEDGKIEKMLELLTQRERQIAGLVSEGMSNKEIARKLNVSQGTVKVHLYNIFQKLEISNRTVLATISLLQRTSGFGALALAFLAFAIADELKASEGNDMFPNDDGSGHGGEHAGYEIWKKAILQHLMVSQSGETLPLTESDLFAKASQAANPAAAMEALRAAEQFMGSKAWKDAGPVGSSTPNNAALLLRAADDTPIGGDPAREQHVQRLASDPMSIHGGYATFAALAGALIYALSESQAAAQPHELGQASIDSVLASIGENATTKQAAITHVDDKHADNSAPDSLSHDVRPSFAFVTTGHENIAQEGVRSQTVLDVAGDTLQKPVGILDVGHDSGLGGYSRDQLMDGNVENVVYRSSSESKSVSSDTALDFDSGPGRLNLAAFGALAFLHLTAATKSIPPHTLAWVYNSATNETIVYVNSTDRILDIGDRGLLEIHLQGIVSIAASDFGHQPEGAAVAATLEQLEQALIPAIATDQAVLSTDSIYESESSLGAAALWSASVDEGLSFQFAQTRTGPGRSTESRTFTRDTVDTTEEGVAASGVSAPVSSIAHGHGAAAPAVENFTSKSQPTNADTVALSTKQSEVVPPGLAKADSTGRGHSDHASEPESAQAATDSAGQGAGHQAPASEAARASAAEKRSDQPAVDHGNSGHDQHPSSTKPSKAAEPSVSIADSAGRGHSGHASKPGSKEAATDSTEPGNGVGHGAGHQAPASEAARASAAEKRSDQAAVDHGNSGHDLHPSFTKTSKAAETAGPSVSKADDVGGGHSQHSSEQGSAKAAAKGMAEAKSTPDAGAGHDKEHHSSASDGAPGAAKTAEKGSADHSNAGHSTSANAPDAEPNSATVDSDGRDHSQHAGNAGSPKTVTAEMIEADLVPGRGVGIGAQHHDPASDTAKAPAAGKTAEPDRAAVEHGKSWHSTAADTAEATESAEASAATGRDAGGGHAKQASQSGASASEASQPAKTAFGMGGADQSAFRFDHEATPSTLVAVVEPRDIPGPHVVPGQEVDSGMFVEKVHAPDEDAVHPGNHSPYNGIVPPPHDLLI